MAEVTSDRTDEYGHPADDFARLAKRFSITLGTEVDETTVVKLMIDLKLNRLDHNPTHEDSWRDIMGYVDCLDRINRRKAGIE